MRALRYVTHSFLAAVSKSGRTVFVFWPVSLAVLILAVVLVVAMRKSRRIRICSAGLLIYVYLVLCLTVLSRVPKDISAANLELFWTMRHILSNPQDLLEYGTELAANVILFLPIGLFFGGIAAYRDRWYQLLGALGVVFVAAALSTAIELVQYRFRLGLAEIDDCLHNTLGAALGYMLALGIAAFQKSQRKS